MYQWRQIGLPHSKSRWVSQFDAFTSGGPLPARGIGEPDTVARRAVPDFLPRRRRCSSGGSGLWDGSVDQCGEAIAHARHGLDVLLARGFLAQRLPQHRHVVIQVVFLDRRLRPHRVEQFLLRDQPPGVLDQRQERVEHLQTQRDHLTAARESALTDIEMKRPELIRASFRGLGHESHLRKVSEIRQHSQRTPAPA